MDEALETSIESAPVEPSQEPQESLNTSTEPSSPVFDLDSVGKFKFDGKEWDKQTFKRAYLAQSDYTKKTQELATQRKEIESVKSESKFYNALATDLEQVKNDPSLAEKFKQVYPEKFHGYLRYVLENQTGQTQAAQNALDPRAEARIKQIESKLEEKEIESINAKLDVKFADLAKKYPALENKKLQDFAISQAQLMLQNGTALTDQVWENIFKSIHDEVLGTAGKLQSAKITKQKQANIAGKDVASGGAIASQAPRKARTIKETGNLYRDEILAQL